MPLYNGKWNQAFLAFFLAWAMLLASSWSSCWFFSMPCLGTRMGMSMPSCLRWPHCKLASSAVGAALTHENGTRMPSWSWDSEAFCFQLPMAHLAPKCCMYSLGSWPSLTLLMGSSGTSLNCALWVGTAGHLGLSHTLALEGLVQSHCDLGFLEIFHHLGVGKWQSLAHDLWTGQHWHVLFGQSPPFPLVQWHLDNDLWVAAESSMLVNWKTWLPCSLGRQYLFGNTHA